jgi:hypothetical protein
MGRFSDVWHAIGARRGRLDCPSRRLESSPTRSPASTRSSRGATAATRSSELGELAATMALLAEELEALRERVERPIEKLPWDHCPVAAASP